MSFAISDTLVSCRVLEEESLTSSQLSLSCTLQSFFSEATSCSVLFSLAVGQGLAAVVQSRGYPFLSPIFSQKTTKILSSVASSITEGICFNTASELARSGELQMGSLTENFHGIATILVCKAMGRGVLAQSAVVKNLVQNSALMAVDVTFEDCGWIERKNFTLVERYFNCQLTSFRMEVSATFLGTVCPQVGIMKAKLELDYELQKSERKKSPSENRHWIDSFMDLFSPELAGNNGEKLQSIHIPRPESNQTIPVITAADLIMQMTNKSAGKRINGRMLGISQVTTIPTKSSLADFLKLQKTEPKMARQVLIALIAWHESVEVHFSSPGKSKQPTFREVVKTFFAELNDSTLSTTWIETRIIPLAKSYLEIAQKIFLRKEGFDLLKEERIIEAYQRALLAIHRIQLKNFIPIAGLKVFKPRVKVVPPFHEEFVRVTKKYSLTPTDTARRFGCDRTKYYEYRNGKSYPKLEFLLRFFSVEQRLLLSEKSDLYISRFPELIPLGIVDIENRIWIKDWRQTFNEFDFGDFIREKREGKKLTKEAVGRATEMTGMNIHDYENGNVDFIPFHRLPPLAEVLGVDLGLLTVIAHPELWLCFQIHNSTTSAKFSLQVESEKIPLHERIKNFIQKRKYKSGVVAKALQLSRGNAYYGMINGTHKPSVAVLLRLFKMDPDTVTREKLSIYGALYPKFEDLKIADPEGKIFVQVGREIFQQTTFGAYIRRSRERKKLSTQKMAEELEITRSTYEYLENDKMGEISYEHVEALAKTLEEDRSLLALMSHPELFEIAEIIYQ